jgi:cell division protein FtsL
MSDIFISDIKEEKKEAAPAPMEPVVKPKPKYKLEKTSGHTHSPLAAFSFWPEKVDFEAKDSEEEVVLLLRRHPVTNFGWFLISAAMVITPMVLTRLQILNFLPDNYRLIAVLIWYLVTSAYVLQSFLGWLFNVHVVTDERIVDIDFSNLIYKQVSDANIDKIQDVTYKMGGVARTIFNFGDVLIQTAGEVPNFEFEAVPNPARVAKILQDLRLEEAQEAVEGRIR